MTNLQPIEKWFSGKALKTLREYVMPMLAKAEKEGCWPKGVSRTVRAALNKQSVARKFGQENISVLESIREDRTSAYWHSKKNGYGLGFAMEFGQFEKAWALVAVADELGTLVDGDREREILETATSWARDFAPVAALVEFLDSARPEPVFIMETLSPTIYANVGKTMGVDLTSIRFPEIRWEWMEFTRPNGTKYRLKVGFIIWPKGTRHEVSRFSLGTENNEQCESCGHAIKNRGNWVPLVAETKEGPVSLWVGKDCAGKLFGCKVKGEMELVEVGETPVGMEGA